MKFLGVIDHFTRCETSETTNKIILFGVSREQDWIKKVWTENLNKRCWPYHTTSHLTIWESSLVMIGEDDIVISVKINMPTWGRHTLSEGVNLDNLAVMPRITRRFDIKVSQRG